MLDSLAMSTFEASVCAGGTAGVRLALRGELDMAAAPELVALLDSPVVVEAAELVLDLADLDFLDLAGLRVLLAARRRTTPAARLVLGGSRTRRLFDLTGNASLVDDPPLSASSVAARRVEATGPTPRRVTRAGRGLRDARRSCCSA